MAFACATCCSGEENAPEPISFGVLADVQYADQDTVGKRHLREALPSLAECVAELNARQPAFVIQVGDLAGGGREDLLRALDVYNGLSMETHHVLGNHDFAMARPELLATLGMESAYYSFRRGGWRFVVLDAQDIGLGYGRPEDSEQHRQAIKMLAELAEDGRPNAVDWNGAIGEEQQAWLAQELRDAGEQGERVIVFCHMPLLAAACRPEYVLWNNDAILAILEANPSVAAVVSGHDHAGGYAEQRGIHHITLAGMVDAPEENAYALVHLHADRIEIAGVGAVPSRTLPIREPRRETEPDS
jgi:3',5'-cyclic AMP phosphodiesterase CpdA